VCEFRRVGGHFDFSGLLDVTKLVEKSRISGAVLETTDIRDVVLLVDRAAEWREIALHPPANMRTKWRQTRMLSENIPDFTEFLRSSATKFSPMEPPKIALRRNCRGFAVRSKSKSASFRNRFAAICASSPKVAQHRMSW